MQDAQIGGVIRALRHRLDWTQEELSRRAKVSRSVIARAEAGLIDRIAVRLLRQVVQALGARMTLGVQWRGELLDQLLDAGHAALADLWQRRLEGWGWIVHAEVSFNVYGDRGRIDLLAYHPGLRVLLVIEIKTRIADIQALLGPLDVKERLAHEVARRFGWEPVMVVPMIVVEESSSCRRRVNGHPALFASFAVRGREAISWVRRPDRRVPGLLLFTTPPTARSRSGRRAGRQRVRPSGHRLSVQSGSESAIQTDAAI
jgi:transcriptional regulator with XRE-family HTH domain